MTDWIWPACTMWRCDCERDCDCERRCVVVQVPVLWGGGGGEGGGEGITMQFSHSISLVLDAPTMSGMKLGHLCGQSCSTPHTRCWWKTMGTRSFSYILQCSEQLHQIRMMDLHG